MSRDNQGQVPFACALYQRANGACRGIQAYLLRAHQHRFRWGMVRDLMSSC